MGEKTLYVYLFRLFPRGFLGYFNTITFAFPSLKTIFSLYIFIVHIRTFYTCICYSLSLSSTALPPHFPLSSLSTWCGVGRRKRANDPDSILLDSPYPSREWKVPKTPFSELYLESLAPEENQCGSDVGQEEWFALAPALRVLWDWSTHTCGLQMLALHY